MLLALNVATLHLPSGVVQRTRAYNGSVPGPTVRAAPGERLVMHLCNQLGRESSSDARVENQFHSINTTGLHTHGLHISPRRPSDDVFVEVAPGACTDFVYDIPAYHMGGTFWYHPHAHGSSTLQAGGGALGMLIIDDPPGSLPPEVAAAEERHIVVSDLRMASLANVARRYEAACLAAGGDAAACHESLWSDGPVVGAALDDLLMVNGQLEPTTQLDADRWYRFRILFGSSGGQSGSGGGGHMGMMGDFRGADLMPTLRGCETQLLAKDGIYLHTAPRPIDRGFSKAVAPLSHSARARLTPVPRLAARPCGRSTDTTTHTTRTAVLSSPLATTMRHKPAAVSEHVDCLCCTVAAGNRADWMVRCPAGSHSLVDEMSGATLVHVRVAASARAAEGPIVPFAVDRPCYLVDLSAARVDVSHDVKLEPMAFKLTSDGGRPEAFPGEGAPAFSIPVGKAVELRVHGATNMMHHIFHIHVNPFQLQDEPNERVREAVGDYFQRGDWHDTIRMPRTGTSSPIRTRMQTDAFTGAVVMHCHYLTHQDQGMMGTVAVVGTEGSTYAEAERLDPRCYREVTAATRTFRRINVTTTNPRGAHTIVRGTTVYGGEATAAHLLLLGAAAIVLVAFATAAWGWSGRYRTGKAAMPTETLTLN